MINKAILLGRVGSKDVTTLKSGVMAARVSMVTVETYKDSQNQKQEKKEWHTVKSYGKIAEIINKYVEKGDLLYVEGKMETQEYKDKNGIDKKAYSINAGIIKLIPKVEKNKQTNQDFEDDNIPF